MMGTRIVIKVTSSTRSDVLADTKESVLIVCQRGTVIAEDDGELRTPGRKTKRRDDSDAESRTSRGKLCHEKVTEEEDTTNFAQLPVLVAQMLLNTIFYACSSFSESRYDGSSISKSYQGSWRYVFTSPPPHSIAYTKA